MTDAPAPPATPPTSRPIAAAPLNVWQRLWCLILALGCATMLGMGAWATPNPAGHGTHTQLGMPPCGWKVALGYPCATCGMTTSVSHAAHADLWASLTTQPFGFLVALGAGVAFWLCLHGAATGSRVDRVLWWFLRPRMLTLSGILFLAAWGYKVLTDASGLA